MKNFIEIFDNTLINCDEILYTEPKFDNNNNISMLIITMKNGKVFIQEDTLLAEDLAIEIKEAVLN